MEEVKPKVGSVVHRVNMSNERSTVVLVGENIVLENEFGWYHTTRMEAFLKWYVVVSE